MYNIGIRLNYFFSYVKMIAFDLNLFYFKRFDFFQYDMANV